MNQFVNTVTYNMPALQTPARWGRKSSLHLHVADMHYRSQYSVRSPCQHLPVSWAGEDSTALCVYMSHCNICISAVTTVQRQVFFHHLGRPATHRRCLVGLPPSYCSLAKPCCAMFCVPKHMLASNSSVVATLPEEQCASHSKVTAHSDAAHKAYGGIPGHAVLQWLDCTAGSSTAGSSTVQPQH
jgi:hypothetical protein